jgi:hypothetical protein
MLVRLDKEHAEHGVAEHWEDYWLFIMKRGEVPSQACGVVSLARGGAVQ